MDQDPFVPPTSKPAVHTPSGRPFDPTVLPDPEVPPLPPREPAVLPWAPGRGWSRAGLAHRTMAVASLPVVIAQVGLAVWTLVDQPGGVVGTSQGTSAVGWLMLVSYLLAPPTFYAAARVLRPHVRRGGERAARHLMAATATALALPVLTMLITAKLVSAPESANLANLLGVPPVLTPNIDNQLAVQILLGVPAFLLGLVTSLWGLAAAVVRAMSR